HAFVIPNGFLCLGKKLSQKTTASILGKKDVESPLTLLKSTYVENIHYQQVAGLSAFYTYRAGEKVNLSQIHIALVISTVVIRNLPAGPVITFNNKIVARFNCGCHGNIRMPAVVNHLVFVRRFCQINLDDSFSHCGGS